MYQAVGCWDPPEPCAADEMLRAPLSKRHADQGRKLGLTHDFRVGALTGRFPNFPALFLDVLLGTSIVLGNSCGWTWKLPSAISHSPSSSRTLRKSLMSCLLLSTKCFQGAPFLASLRIRRTPRPSLATLFRPYHSGTRWGESLMRTARIVAFDQQRPDRYIGLPTRRVPYRGSSPCLVLRRSLGVRSRLRRRPCWRGSPSRRSGVLAASMRRLATPDPLSLPFLVYYSRAVSGAPNCLKVQMYARPGFICGQRHSIDYPVHKR
jgi:hypothetical protein